MKILSSAVNAATALGGTLTTTAYITFQFSPALAISAPNNTYRRQTEQTRVAFTSPKRNFISTNIIPLEQAREWIDIKLQEVEREINENRRAQSQVSIYDTNENSCFNASKQAPLLEFKRHLVLARWKILEAINKRDNNALAEILHRIGELQLIIERTTRQNFERCIPPTTFIATKS
jgi:hypothetical protein